MPRTATSACTTFGQRAFDVASSNVTEILFIFQFVVAIRVVDVVVGAIVFVGH